MAAGGSAVGEKVVEEKAEIQGKKKLVGVIHQYPRLQSRAGDRLEEMLLPR